MSLLSGKTFCEFLRLIFWKIHSYDNFARFQKINFKNAPNLSGTQETPLKSVRLAIIWTTHKLLYLCNIEKACPNWWRFRFQKSATSRCSMLENATTEYITSKTSLYTSGDSVVRVIDRWGGNNLGFESKIFHFANRVMRLQVNCAFL